MNRSRLYEDARYAFGANTQVIVAIEELSELQKELCKALRGQLNIDHLTEEIADVRIMLEQMQKLYHIKERTVYDLEEQKLRRLQDRVAEAIDSITQ